jgi:cytosine/creatinine deaminase
MLQLLVKRANLNGQIKDIGISHGKIEVIKDEINMPSEYTFDAQKRVVIPGFVDAHMHLDKSMLNLKSDYVEGTGAEKGELTLQRKEKFTVEDITDRAERVIQRAIKAGTIAIRTNVDVDGTVGLKGIEALINLREKYKDILTIQIVAFAQEGVFHDEETQTLLKQALELGADLIGGHTIAKGEGKRHIDYILSLAKQYNVEADFHLDESGLRDHYLLPYLTERMKELDLVGKVNGIHCCTLSALNDEELNMALQSMQESQLKITIAPTAISTRSLAPVKKILEKGLVVAIGSDNVRDFFNPLGSGDIKQAALLLSYVHRFYQEHEIQQIWGMITDKGASLLGIKDYIIEEGAIANLTICDGYSSKEVLSYSSQPVLLIRKGKVVSSTLLSTQEK